MQPAPTSKFLPGLDLSIGGLELRLFFQVSEPGLRQASQQHFEGFLTRGHGHQFPVLVNVVQGQPSSSSEYLIRNSRLYWADDHACVDRVSDVYELTLVLRALLSLLLVDNCGVLLHSSCVLNEGNAYVFAGPSGAGKSTLASLSRPRMIYAEEGTLLRMTGNQLRCYSTPFWTDPDGLGLVPFNHDAPAAGVYSLVQGDESRTERLSAYEGVRLLLANQMLLQRNENLLRKTLHNAAAIASATPMYRLFFRPEASVWTALVASVAEVSIA